MTENFTASNGGTVETITSGRVIVRDDTPFEYSDGTTRAGQHSYLDPGQIITLREFFQAEADERLGRWRWPENPDYIVYQFPEWPDSVRVVDERTGHSNHFSRERAYAVTLSEKPFPEGARAYFDAHPEPKPKPWHDAAEGEVWELEFKAGKSAWFVNGAYFQSTKTLTNIYKTDPDILSAHRIYPPAD